MANPETPETDATATATGGGAKPGDKPKDAAPSKDGGKDGAKADGKKDEGKKRIGDEPEEKSIQDLFLENLPTIVVLAVLFALIPVWWSSHRRSRLENSKQAWADLADARGKALPEAKFDALAQRHDGTSAEPFIKMSWAAKLYETGEKTKVQRALDLYKEIARDHSELPLVARLVPEQIKRLEAELADPKAHWAPETGDRPEQKPGVAPPCSATH